VEGRRLLRLHRPEQGPEPTWSESRPLPEKEVDTATRPFFTVCGAFLQHKSLNLAHSTSQPNYNVHPGYAAIVTNPFPLLGQQQASPRITPGYQSQRRNERQAHVQALKINSRNPTQRGQGHRYEAVSQSQARHTIAIMCFEHQQKWKGYGHQCFLRYEFCNHFPEDCLGPDGFDSSRPTTKEHEGVCESCRAQKHYPNPEAREEDRQRLVREVEAREAKDVQLWLRREQLDKAAAEERDTWGPLHKRGGRKRQREDEPTANADKSTNKKKVRTSFPEGMVLRPGDDKDDEDGEDEEEEQGRAQPPRLSLRENGHFQLSVPADRHQEYHPPPSGPAPSYVGATALNTAYTAHQEYYPPPPGPPPIFAHQTGLDTVNGPQRPCCFPPAGPPPSYGNHPAVPYQLSTPNVPEGCKDWRHGSSK